MNKPKPADWYKEMRPELFSDSETIEIASLTEELFSFELQEITTNQKENQFQALCRRLAERFIAPNLIPEVGPSGGGDGKTDAETYPIDEELLSRIFIPQNGWNNNHKWAFAISAKKAWRPKLKSDIQSAISTGREFTHIYFITNQQVSSKKKKEAEDSFSTEFSVGITILDKKWIIEKIFNNDLIEMAVRTLGMSSAFVPQKKLGPRDSIRQQEFDAIEQKIANSSSYSILDFQLFEDTLSLAILARQLAHPREEVEGLFAKTIGYASQRNDIMQLRRAYEQIGWTHCMYYDDLPAFVEDYKHFVQYNDSIEKVNELELAFTMHSLLWQTRPFIDLNVYGIDIGSETLKLKNLFNTFKQNSTAPNLALLADSYLTILEILESLEQKQHCSDLFHKLSEIIKQSHGLLEFPFNSIAACIKDGLSHIFYADEKFDELIVVVAEEEATRKSRASAGATYYSRAFIKIEHNENKDAVIYLGRALMKFSVEEHKEEFVHCLLCLGYCYRDLGLLWASNNAFVMGCNISFAEWLHQKEEFFLKITICGLKEIINNELSIGRIPIFLAWRELILILRQQNDNILFRELLSEETITMWDGCLGIRLLNTDIEHLNASGFLPSIFRRNQLLLCEDIVLFMLGYENVVANNNQSMTDTEFIDFIKLMANQPAKQQIFYETSSFNRDKEKLQSHVLGVKINVVFELRYFNLWMGEAILAFFENIFSTSMGKIFLSSSIINIELLDTDKTTPYYVSLDRYSYNVYCVNTNVDFTKFAKVLINLFSEIISKHGYAESIITYVNNLFEQEEVTERLSSILGHCGAMQYFWGKAQRIKLSQWYEKADVERKYIRKTPLDFSMQKTSAKQPKEKDNKHLGTLDSLKHNDIEVLGLIEPRLWDQAAWRGTCFMEIPQHCIILGLAFENIDYGNKVFEDLLAKTGRDDTENQIRISLIKGINKLHPCWYRIVIGQNVPSTTCNKGICGMSRIHEMNAESHENLDRFIKNLSTYRSFYFAPIDVKNLEADRNFMKYAIRMQNINIRDAWEIGKHDWDRIAIREDDMPIIPSNVSNPPVNEIIKII